MTLKNFLGYVLAVVLITAFVLTGLTLIRTDGQLVVTLVGVMMLILLMGIVSTYLRFQRLTKREFYRQTVHNSYDHISPFEQKMVQMTWVLLISMIILGGIIKGPKLMQLISVSVFGHI